mgnify:CR=1 FL=1
MSYNIWNKLNNIPINKQALKDLLQSKEYEYSDELYVTDASGKKRFYTEHLPAYANTKFWTWYPDQRKFFGQKFGDLKIIGKQTVAPNITKFFAHMQRVHGSDYDLSNYLEDWKNWKAKKKPKTTYICQCSCSRYVLRTLSTLRKQENENLLCCPYCIKMKILRGQSL